MSDLPIVTRSLAKNYGATCALAPCSIEVQAGEILGLLGPNGAGKTTLLRLLLGYLRPSAGWAKVAGRDAYQQRVAVHRGLGYLPGEARLFRRLRGREVLRFFGDVHPRGDFHRARHVAERLEVDTSRQIARCSTGMRQKIALAAVLSLDVPLLILDEPTTNLDPTARDVVLELVQESQSQGRTILFSSHVLSEVETICHRAALLRGGELVHVAKIAELRKSHRVQARLSGEKINFAQAPQGTSVLGQTDHRVTLEISGPPAEALRWLGGLPLEELQIEPLGLRTIYNRYVLEREA